MDHESFIRMFNKSTVSTHIIVFDIRIFDKRSHACTCNVFSWLNIMTFIVFIHSKEIVHNLLSNNSGRTKAHLSFVISFRTTFYLTL